MNPYKMNLCCTYDLGLTEYNKALQIQDKLASACSAGTSPNVILFLEHPSVLTIGRSGSEENIITSRNLLDEEGIHVFHVDRGGDITYHGPGQLVGYLIFDLRAQGRDVHQHVRNMEEVIIRGLSEFSIEGKRHPQYPGVWVRDEKICSLGIRVSRWITRHGFALNVNTDLRYFNYINPCGITDKRVTSMSNLLGHDIDMGDVKLCLLRHVAQVFDLYIGKKR